MKVLSRAIAFKAILACLLLLQQGNVFAQEEGVPDTVTAIIDTSAYPGVVSEDEEQKAEPVPDIPVFRRVPDSIVKELQADKEFEYANDPAYWVKEKPKDYELTWFDRLLMWPGLKYVIITLMVAVLVYALVRIVISNRLVLFRGRPTAATQFSDEEDLLNNDNLGDLITRAEQAGNLRLAVRYRYMKTLQDMNSHKLIQLDARSTNWDYVNKLGGHPLKKQFQLLTRAYEYVWYGEFEINGGQYNYVKTEFQKFENAL